MSSRATLSLRRAGICAAKGAAGSALQLLRNSAVHAARLDHDQFSMCDQWTFVVEPSVVGGHGGRARGGADGRTTEPKSVVERQAAAVAFLRHFGFALPRRGGTALRRLQSLDARTHPLRASRVTDLHRQSATEVLHCQAVGLRGSERRKGSVGLVGSVLV